MEWIKLSEQEPVYDIDGSKQGYEVLVRREIDKDDGWFEYFTAIYFDEETPEWHVNMNIEGTKGTSNCIHISVSFEVSKNYDCWRMLEDEIFE